MSETMYTRVQVTAALGRAHGLLDAVTSTGPVDLLTVRTWQRLGTGPFTREQVSGALNYVADALDDAAAYETSSTIWAQDVRNLAVNTALYLLDHPQGSLAEAIAASWSDLDNLSCTVLDALPEGAPEPARGTPERDAAIVATVLEWVS